MRMRTLPAAILAAAAFLSTVHAADDAKALTLSKTASILRREKVGAPWQFVAQKEALQSGDLLLGLPGAQLSSADKSVQLTFLTDFGDSPFPVRECAVILQESKDANLDFTLERGRADLTNTKANGPTLVKVHVRDQVFEMRLNTPGTHVALELYGRWQAGQRFKKEPGPKDGPSAQLVLLVLSGSIELKHNGTTLAMAAPPGAALIQWDNQSGLDKTPHKLPELPSWAKPEEENNPKALVLKKVFAHYYELAKTKTLEQILEDLIASDDKDFQMSFVTLCAATDRLDLLAPVLRQPKYAALWDHSIRVLRHWIGRAPGQDQLLYRKLIESKLYKPVEAETALQLLHSFGEDELARPEVYETLIDYLEDERVLIRALANWHLQRLVPQGAEFKFNPVGEKPERDEVVKKWRKLVPAGKLPPKAEK